MTKPKDYALAVGDISRERYEIFAYLYNPFSLEFLRQKNIKDGMRVLDVGCGIGDMTCELAKLVGGKGQAIGIDASKEQLEIAKQVANKNKLQNIQFVECLADQLVALEQTFDLVYCRALLNTQKNPKQIIQQMYNVLAPNGILICEEPRTDKNFFCHPTSSAYQRWEKCFAKLAEISGKDFVFNFNIGCELYSWFKDLNLNAIHGRVIQPLLITPYEKRQLTLQIIELTPTLIKTGLATQAELEQLVDDLEEFEKDNAYIAGFFPCLQIVGIKTQ